MLLIRRGRGGFAPTERKSEGGWVGQSRAQRVLVRDGGVGGAAPTGDGACSRRPSPPPSPSGRGGRTVRPRRLGAGSQGCAVCAEVEGGVGAQPPQKENPRVGGWARAARSACWSGMGVWGAQPPQETGPVLGGPHPRPLPRGEGAGRCALGGLVRAPKAAPCAPKSRGAWGRSPHRKKIRGWVGGPEPRAARARPGWGCGASFTGREDTPQGPPQETRACPRGPQSGYVLAAACSARRAIARGRPSKMRRWIGQSAYQ